jgi:two-component system, NarL family, response regulator NreC
MRSARILLADDHGIVRQGLRSVLSRDSTFEIVGEAADGREAVALAESLDPNVVIMDIAMPGLNGIDATAQIVKRNPGVAVLILSMHSDETYLLRALNAGAKGYLLKDSADVDLVRAVREALRGRPFFSPEIAQVLLEDYLRALQQKQLLAQGKNNKDIATALDLSTNTVESHRNNLMKKLSLHNTAELVLYAVRKKIISC